MDGWNLSDGCIPLNFNHLDTQNSHISGQIIATSHDLTPNGGLVREITGYFRQI